MRRVLPCSEHEPLHDTAATRAIEQRALAALPPHTLMRRAGVAVARLAIAIAPHARRIWVAAGPGNNGGDGLEAALHLREAGRDVQVSLFAADSRRASDDARDALARARAAGVPMTHGLAPMQPPPELIIDALLGLGAARAPHGAIAQAIGAINDGAAPRLAIDLPSGLHADHGQPLGDACVRATHTLALLTLKPGLFTGAGRDFAGEIWHESLDVDLADAPSAWLSGAASRTARRHAQHKGSFGDVLVIGGARGMAGAPLLAGRAALAAGAGRVFICPLDADAPLLDRARPELMLRPLAWGISNDVLARSTVVCGCGGGEAVREVLDAVITRAGSLVLDADALNALAADASLRARLRARAAQQRPTVLTPHPLEAARLLGASDVRAVQADRLRAAQTLADDLAALVLLKGSGSVIAAPASVPHINPTGNAALASAGTGDVLAGWIGGEWSAVTRDADGAWHATVASAWRHGAAADAAGAERPLRASDLIDAMHALG